VWERTGNNHTIPHAAGEPLLNVDLAVFNDDKTLNYSLDLDSADPKARGHAKGFLDFLGMTKRDADSLKQQVMSQLARIKAERGKSDTYGERFNVYVPVTGPNGRTIDVRTAWIYEKGRYGSAVRTVPHLATIFMDKKGIRKYEQAYP
jgi:filamentous hemagglutinin